MVRPAALRTTRCLQLFVKYDNIKGLEDAL